MERCGKPEIDSPIELSLGLGCGEDVALPSRPVATCVVVGVGGIFTVGNRRIIQHHVGTMPGTTRGKAEVFSKGGDLSNLAKAIDVG